MKTFPIAQFKDFPKELAALRRLRTPARIQDFLETLRINDTKGRRHTYASPVAALRAGKAHCMEGALIAAAALWLQGRPPLIMDLKTADPDVDHVIALFQEGSRWGAITKTNHAVLRWRDPVFRDPREIAMSYFNEYFLDNGVKTLRSFSVPFDLSGLDPAWLTAKHSLDAVANALDRSRHVPLLKKDAVRRLRKADPIEIKAGKLVEWE